MCARAAAGPPGRFAIDALTLAKKAQAALEDKKGEDIVLLDVQGVSSVTDFFLIVSGSSTPHLKAMFNDLQVILKGDGIACYRKAGTPESGWMILDYVDVVIHIFSSQARDYYEIEKLWASDPQAT